MKTFLIAAACFAVAVAGPTRFIPVGPSGPAPVIDGEYHPISVGPAIVEGEYEPISVGPVVVEDEHEEISVGPAIVDEKPIDIEDHPVVEAASSPLVQIIVNVNSASANPVAVESSPVVVGPGFETIHEDEFDAAPVIEGPEVEADPIDFVDDEEVDPTPVIVVDEAEVVEPVLVAPINPLPVVNVPEILN